jgi:TolB-like protein
MSSLIPGYEYDIFISYRQKDNKHDGWVTEFVNNLKGEIESTFKEEVSVYFDINPHDGLLETHDVDASLKEKLKCAVFIPIISRTYCDPKSFAWEHEFKAFVDQVSGDQFGLKVKLPNGNVASRVLPVRIHDLDNNDIKLCESVLGGVLRGVEFIFKSPGVNRPLLPKEENPQENQNHTSYRDQINKVANAVQEIISGLMAAGNGEELNLQEEESEKELENEEIAIRQKKREIGIIVGLVLILFVGSLFVFQFLGRKNSPDKQLEKSIAVLPFHNYSGDPTQEYMSDGLTDEIISHLQKIKSFDKVVSLSSVLTYKATEKRLPQIAGELKVSYILEGTYKKIGEKVKVTAKLIEPQNEKNLWQQNYDRPFKEIIDIQSDIALQIATNINAFITGSEKQNIQKIPTANFEAYDLLQQALSNLNSVFRDTSNFSFNFFTKGINLAKRAIELDPNYADAYAFAGAYLLFSGAYSGFKEFPVAMLDALPYIEKALELDQNNSLANYTMGIIDEWGRWDYIKAEKEYLKAIELAPNKVDDTYIQYCEFYIKMDQPERALYFINKMCKTNLNVPASQMVSLFVLSDNKKRAYDSLYSYNANSEGYWYKKWSGRCFIWLEEYDSARFYLESSLKSGDPQMLIPRFQSYLAFVNYKTQNFQQAKAIIYQLISNSKETSIGSPDYFLGWYYSGIGQLDSAFYWLEKACQNRSAEMPWLKVDPVFKNLKGDKRYWDLYERTGHKAYDDYIAGMKK